MTEILVENLKIGKIIRSSSFFFSDQKKYHHEKENDPRYVGSASGIGVVLDKDAQQSGEVVKQMDRLKLKKEPRLKWDLNLSLECKREKVSKMHLANMKKFLLLNIAIISRKSNGCRLSKEWYCIDLSKIRCEGNNLVDGTMNLNIMKLPEISPYPSICVALGSVIYIIATNYDTQIRSARIYYLDTSNPENGWLEGPFLNCCRERGSAVVHDKKIYIFGGFNMFSGEEYWTSEVYDPVLNSSEPLSEPPDGVDNLQGNFVGSYKDKKILVHSYRLETLYAYDVVDKSWEVLDRCFGYWPFRGVIMDEVLYVFDYVKVEIGGYDLTRLKWLKPINLDSLKWFSRTRDSGMILDEAFFFKVEANLLCLLYFDQKGKAGLDIYCKTFTIIKITQEGSDVELELDVFSSTIYNLGEKGRCLNYVVMQC